MTKLGYQELVQLSNAFLEEEGTGISTRLPSKRITFQCRGEAEGGKRRAAQGRARKEGDTTCLTRCVLLFSLTRLFAGLAISFDDGLDESVIHAFC